MKEAVLKLEIYVSFDEAKVTEQKALDTLEEIVNELEDKHSISTVIHERKIQRSVG